MTIETLQQELALDEYKVGALSSDYVDEFCF